MQRVKDNGNWSLFCPNECPGLPDTFGEEFEALYTKYENMPDRVRQTVPAQQLWFAILGWIASEAIGTEWVTIHLQLFGCDLACLFLVAENKQVSFLVTIICHFQSLSPNMLCKALYRSFLHSCFSIRMMKDRLALVFLGWLLLLLLVYLGFLCFKTEFCVFDPNFFTFRYFSS